MKDFIWQTKSMATESTLGPMVRSTLAGGQMESNTALESFCPKKGKESWGSGKMERKAAGSLKKKLSKWKKEN